MSNIFLTEKYRDTETAIMLEKAHQCKLGDLDKRHENAVAFTDGARVFINSDDELSRILPAYDYGMLKWLLWHERFHMELKHHNRFFKYLDELKREDIEKEFQVTKDEVNIIMDVLVHDSLAKLFPELVETAVNNFAQMRNRNSLKYTFKTNTLEEMLDEYRAHKKGEDTGDGDKSEDTGDKKEDDKKEDRKAPSKSKKKGHAGGGGISKETGEETEKDESPAPDESEHDKTDWTKLEDIDDTEFIDRRDADDYITEINKLKRKKFQLGQLTKALNALATTTRERTYKMPSYVNVGKHTILKGKAPGKTALYVVFDASGSMGSELHTFKEIISKSIPHAMDCPCEWFSGYSRKCVSHLAHPHTHNGYTNNDYYKGKFKDIMTVDASNGYGDDGDRVLELCLEAERKGYSPIGVTDGGGGIYDPETAKKLKKSIIVSPCGWWLKELKDLNPNVQTLEVERG